MADAPVFQIWTAPRCAIGAQAVSSLPPTVAVQITESVSNGDDSGSMTLPRSIALECGVSEGRILRAWWPQRGTYEWPIVSVRDGEPGDTTTVTLGTMRALLAWRGLVRTAGSVRVDYDIAASAGTVSDVLNSRVLTNLADDGLEWLSAGTIDFTGSYDWPAQSRVRRGEVLALIEQVTGGEVVLRRLSNDAGYAIDVLSERGSTIATRLITGAWHAVDRTRDLLQTATEVVGLCDDGSAMGEVDWVGGTASGNWIPLSDPDGGADPIQEDGQCVGCWLALPDGSVLSITDSRASDSAVNVVTLGTYTTGQRVSIWENTSGRPLSRLTSPSAITARGVVVAEVAVDGALPERTLNENPDLAQGATGWTAYTHSSVADATVMDRADFGRTLTFAANGARGAGTGAGTPFTVDGLPANQKLYRGETIVHSSAQMNVTADAISSTSGVLALTISPGLPAAFADNDPITLVRRETATFSTAIATPKMSTALFLQNADVDLVQRLTAFAVTDGYAPAIAGDVSVEGSVSFAGNVAYLVPLEEDADTMVLCYPGFSGSGPTPTDTVLVQGATGISAHRVRLRVDHLPSSGTEVTINAVGNFGGPLGWQPTWPRWATRLRGGVNPQMIGTIVGSGSSPYNYIDVDFRGLPSTCDLTNVTYIAPQSDAQIFNSSDNWSGNFDVTWERERRTLNFDGAHSLGATSCTFKAVTSIARHDWVFGDKLRTTYGDYSLTAGASWNADGEATLTVSIPSGVTLAAGEHVRASWLDDSRLFVVTAAVTGPASSVTVRGSDAFRSNWDGASAANVVCYRVSDAGSYLSTTGNTLYVASDVTANGSGEASITLTGANANAIGDNALLSITTPAMIPAGESAAGGAIRLLYAPGGPPPTHACGAAANAVYITVPPGEVLAVTAVMRVAISPESSALGIGAAPMIAITGLYGVPNYAYGAVASATTYDEITVLTLSCTAQLSQSGQYRMAVIGGSNSNFDRWHVVLDAQWYVGSDVRPVFDGARSRVLWQRMQQVLKQRSTSVRYQLRGLDLAALADDGTPLQVGQRVRIVNPALGVDDTQRLIKLTWAFPAGEIVEAECAAAVPRLTDTSISL